MRLHHVLLAAPPRGSSPARKAHPGIQVDDVRALDELAALLELAGHPVLPDADLPGYRRFFADDPVGNRLELLAPLDP